jgi:hypothetical protein
VNDAEYARRREAREARRREVEEAAGWSKAGQRPRLSDRRVKPKRGKAKRGSKRYQPSTTKGVYGNSVQGAWRRNNSGGWSRS